MSGGTQDTASSPDCFLLRDSHTLWSRFPAGSHSNRIGNSTHAVLQPPNASTWVWAVPISLAATIGISVIYFPPGTEMVHFPELALSALCIQAVVCRVPPFGNQRVNGYVLLTVAYRSFSRPSSPLSAKAFTACP